MVAKSSTGIGLLTKKAQQRHRPIGAFLRLGDALTWVHLSRPVLGRYGGRRVGAFGLAGSFFPVDQPASSVTPIDLGVMDQNMKRNLIMPSGAEVYPLPPRALQRPIDDLGAAYEALRIATAGISSAIHDGTVTSDGVQFLLMAVTEKLDKTIVDLENLAAPETKDIKAQ